MWLLKKFISYSNDLIRTGLNGKCNQIHLSMISLTPYFLMSNMSLCTCLCPYPYTKTDLSIWGDTFHAYQYALIISSDCNQEWLVWAHTFIDIILNMTCSDCEWKIITCIKSRDVYMHICTCNIVYKWKDRCNKFFFTVLQSIYRAQKPCC